jgi:hypothetical protein
MLKMQSNALMVSKEHMYTVMIELDDFKGWKESFCQYDSCIVVFESHTSIQEGVKEMVEHLVLSGVPAGFALVFDGNDHLNPKWENFKVHFKFNPLFLTVELAKQTKEIGLKAGMVTGRRKKFD